MLINNTEGEQSPSKWLTWFIVAINKENVNESCVFVVTCVTVREASHIDFVHQKCHMNVGGGGGGGLAPVTFLGEKS